MSDTAFSEFRAEVLASDDLREKLLRIDDRAEFTLNVVESASKLEFDVSVADVDNAINTGRRAWIERWI